MTKVRVHELAKELNKTNKEVLDVLRAKKYRGNESYEFIER